VLPVADAGRLHLQSHGRKTPSVPLLRGACSAVNADCRPPRPGPPNTRCHSAIMRSHCRLEFARWTRRSFFIGSWWACCGLTARQVRGLIPKWPWGGWILKPWQVAAVAAVRTCSWISMCLLASSSLARDTLSPPTGRRYNAISLLFIYTAAGARRRAKTQMRNVLARGRVALVAVSQD
jgi:hypothetical protein